MTRSEARQARRALWGELRRRRAEVRARLAVARREAQGRAGALEPVQRARRQRRVRRAAGVAIVAILLSFIRCECGEATPGVVDGATAAPDAGPRSAPPVVRPPAALTGRNERQPRARFAGRPAEATAWLDGFRMQVGARGPRLAHCFSGIDRPGAVRWSAAVNPTSGVVSDHEFELVGPDPGVQATQRRCLEAVLSAPPYALSQTDGEAPTRRVSLVIEF